MSDESQEQMLKMIVENQTKLLAQNSQLLKQHSKATLSQESKDDDVPLHVQVQYLGFTVIYTQYSYSVKGALQKYRFNMLFQCGNCIVLFWHEAKPFI